MGREIERKFLVRKELWTAPDGGTEIKQGYMYFKSGTARIRTAGKKAYITVKGPVKGISRDEFEYEIPYDDALVMLANFCLPEGPLIEKIRYRLHFGGHLWEVDEFSGSNQGLLMAEIELKSENESFEKPVWIGEEVSADFRYFNSNLSRNPFCKWKEC